MDMALTRAKEDLLSENANMCVDAKLQNYDVIPLINSVWDQRFARGESNANDGANRGCNPLKYILRNLPEIRATMTDEGKAAEKSSSNIIMT